MTRRTLGVLIVSAVAVAGGLVAFYLLRSSTPPERVEAPPVRELAPNARTPAELAEAACVRVDLATQAIQANAAAETVRKELAAARVLAAAAMKADARFAALSGGVSALDEAVRRDEPEAAALGLRVAAERCEELRR